jgi:hypothetical protein
VEDVTLVPVAVSIQDQVEGYTLVLEGAYTLDLEEAFILDLEEDYTQAPVEECIQDPPTPPT